MFTQNSQNDEEINDVLRGHDELSAMMEAEDVPLLPGLQELRGGLNVVGQVEGDEGGPSSASLQFVEPEGADFSDYDEMDEVDGPEGADFSIYDDGDDEEF